MSSTYGPPPAAAPAEAVVAEVVAQPCNYTRRELEGLLERCRFGADEAMYAAYFQRDAGGRHLCASCGLVLGQHSAASAPAADGRQPSGQPAPVDPRPFRRGRGVGLNPTRRQRRSPPPGASDGDTGSTTTTTTTSQEAADAIAAPHRRLAGEQPGIAHYPAHWRGGAWFAPFLRFDGFERDRAVRLADADLERVPMRWRCVVPRDQHGGVECGAILRTRGVTVDVRSNRPVPGAVASLEADVADGEIAAHFAREHNVGHRPSATARWSTGLGDCCEHPQAACSCLCCPCGVPCGGTDGRGQSFCEALDRAAPGAGSSQQFVRPLAPDQQLCGCVEMALSGLFTALLLPVVALAGAITVGTCCGFPCGSRDFPPVVCATCYHRRLNIVHAIGADESEPETRCYTVFCCPCSECQQWRELRNSGVWPGLLCCDASAEDRDAMRDAAVRDRYGVDDGATRGVHALRPEEPCPAVAVLNNLPFPEVAWGVV